MLYTHTHTHKVCFYYRYVLWACQINMSIVTYKVVYFLKYNMNSISYDFLIFILILICIYLPLSRKFRNICVLPCRKEGFEFFITSCSWSVNTRLFNLAENNHQWHSCRGYIKVPVGCLTNYDTEDGSKNRSFFNYTQSIPHHFSTFHGIRWKLLKNIFFFD